MVEDDLLSGLGELIPEETIVLVTVTVPHDIKKMTVNLMAPVIINAKTRKGAQVILTEGDNDIHFPIYDILAAAKEGK
jgi:flagellar assembly factor FliW